MHNEFLLTFEPRVFETKVKTGADKSSPELDNELYLLLIN